MKRRFSAFIERNRFLLVFAIMSSLMGVSVGVAQIATSLYAIRLGCSAAMMALIAASQGIGMLVMSMPAGALVDRHGPAAPFVVATVMAGAAYAILPLGASPGCLIACTTVVSFFMPLRFVSLNTVFLRQLATLGEAKAGWYRGTHMVGMYLLGPALAARVVGSFGFEKTYQLIGLMFGATALVSRIVFGPYGGKPKSDGSSGSAGLRGQLALLFRDRELGALSIIEGLNQATTSYFTFFILVVAVKVVHLGAASASELVSAKGMTYIAALFLLGAFVEKMGARRACLASFVVVAGGLGLLGWACTARVLWIGSLALGLGLGTLQIATLTRYARVGQRAGHGRVAGANALVGPAGGLVGNFGGGMIGGFVGLQTVFLFFGAAFVLACAPLVWNANARRWARLRLPATAVRRSD